jgi:hypothetical protein
MAIKMGWDFPSPTNASTRGYTRERGVGTKSPEVGRDESHKNAPTAHITKDKRAGRYAAGIEFTPVASDKNEDRENNRRGRTEHSAKHGYKEGGSVKGCAEDVHKHERHDHPGKPLTKLKEGGNWIAGAVGGKSRGALHRALGVPEGEKIPAKKMASAKRSKSPKIRKEAALAKTLKGFHKG